MGQKSKIQWTDATWNPVTGCTKVSPGCKHCYAEKRSHRLKGRFGYPEDEPFRLTLHEDRLDQPLHWKKPRLIFVNSMSDLFHPDVPYEFIDQVFAVMTLCPQHTFQVLTKRPDIMYDYLSDPHKTYDIHVEMNAFVDGKPPGTLLPLPNVWLGTSCENQQYADERIPWLLKTPAAIRFVSAEPLLGSIDLTPEKSPYLYYNAISDGSPVWRGPNWIIVGGESGPGARPMHPDWVRNIRDHCQKAGVPFFFKQHGNRIYRK